MYRLAKNASPYQIIFIYCANLEQILFSQGFDLLRGRMRSESEPLSKKGKEQGKIS